MRELLGPTAGALEGGGAQGMQDPVSEHPEAPEQRVAIEVIDVRVAEGELAQFLDALLDDSSPVVEEPGVPEQFVEEGDEHTLPVRRNRRPKIAGSGVEYRVM
jgi:hypothetical protein